MKIYKDKERELELLPEGRLKITSLKGKKIINLNRSFCEKNMPSGVSEAIRRAGGNPEEWYILREGIPGQSNPAAALPDITREAVEVAIKEVAAAMKERKEKEEQERKNDLESARGHCPTGYIIARQIWRNGDLCAAKYRTEDGVEILASDLLDPHNGWYYLPVEIVDAERSKQQAKAAKKTEAKAAVAAERAAKFAEALASGKPVVLRKWMTADCTENLPDCSFDSACEMALPDGKTRIKYTHCF